MIKTSDGAGMELSGNATFRVNGAGCTDKYPLYATGRTFVAFHPGSFFRMASGCFYDTYDKKWKPADNSGKNLVHCLVWNHQIKADKLYSLINGLRPLEKGTGVLIGTNFGIQLAITMAEFCSLIAVQCMEVFVLVSTCIVQVA